MKRSQTSRGHRFGGTGDSAGGMVSDDGASAWGSTKMESSGMTNLGDGGAPGSGGGGHRGYGRFGSNRGQDESSGSAAATTSPGYTGGGSSNTPEEGC